MTAITTSPTVGVATLFDTIQSTVAASAQSWRHRLDQYAEYRRSVQELRACSDRTLRDLGVYRGDIKRISREAVYGASA